MTAPDLQVAEDALFARYGAGPPRRRMLRLADPALNVRVLESGEGPPVVFVHGSGMNAGTWAPMLAHLPGRRAVALDLPGFGGSDPHSYSGRTLREHAVAQLTSSLDALGLESAPIVGTSLGGMWALSLALATPQRVTAIVSLGMPAVVLPGLRSDPFFRVMTVPVLGRLASRAPTPRNAAAARKAMARVMGPGATESAPDEFYEVVRLGMAGPGWGEAMWTHLNLALRAGRQRPENIFTDEELRSIATPTRFIWGDGDVYGGPEVGRRAAGLMPHAELEVITGGHAPFLDEPERCAQIVLEATAAR
jgi:pimeloyl-ACP methyl ester carboxylesterase